MVIYARLSVTTEESVSIERQIEAARKYADARGWEVAAEPFVDDGVSATKIKPDERAGWRALITAAEPYDAVIVWKVDRLARRVLDFLHADEALQARGAGIVAVEDPVDMTTAQGRAFATMLAVFGEMEAAAISARVTAARRALLHSGRVAGGRLPFGWISVPNPSGPGLVLAPDPARTAVVAELAQRALAGESLRSLTRWLNETVPEKRWHKHVVELILRNPVLAGMTPYRGDVVRDDRGLPVIDESVAVLSTSEYRQLVATLDARKLPRARPHGDPTLLSGLVLCGSCERPMHRVSSGKTGPMFACPHRDCPRRVTVARPALEAHVAERFLDTFGRLPVVAWEPAATDPSPELADIEAAIRDTAASMTVDDADVTTLASRLEGLKQLRAKARSTAPPAPAVKTRRTGQTFAKAWEAEPDILARRELLEAGLSAVYIDPATRRGGGGLDPSRVRIEWQE